MAIVVDDCLPGEKHPLRNALYAASGFFRNSYDQAMEDEDVYKRQAQGRCRAAAGRPWRGGLSRHGSAEMCIRDSLCAGQR